MPIIKPYRQAVSPEGQVGGQATGSDFGGPGLYQVGQAIESAGSNLAQAQAILAHQQARQEASDADLKLTLFGMDQQEKIRQLKQAHKPGDPDFADTATEEFKKGLEKLQYTENGDQAFTTNYGQRVFTTKSAHLAKTFILDLGKAQAEVKGTDAVAKFNTLTAAYSNSVAKGTEYLNITPHLQQYEQSVRLQLHPDMPEAHREELLRQGKGIIANSAVEGLIRDNPRGAQSALQQGFLAGVLTKDQTSTLLDKAQAGVHMQETADKNAKAAYEHQTEIAKNSALAEVGNLYLKHRSNPDYNPAMAVQESIALMKTKPLLTIKEIGPVIGAYDSDIKEVKSGAKEGNFALSNQLFDQITKGEITDLAPINHARAGYRPHPTDPTKRVTFPPISAAQHQELIGEFNDYRTPDGRSLQKEKAAFEKLIGPQILHPGPFGVYDDATTGAQMQRYIVDLNTQFAQSRKAGRNPYDLFNPQKPDYFGAPSIVDKYQNTSFGSLAPKPVAAVSIPDKPRKSLDEIFGVTK